MTLDTQLRTRLTSAVGDTAVPPGLAHAALAGGRRRRRTRAAAVVALATAAVVGGALLLPNGGPSTTDAQVADRGETGMVALKWARSLPQGDAPGLPFFGEGGGLWSQGQRYDVPAEVNRTVAPRAVVGGWLVFVGQRDEDMRMAVLGADGSLRELPARRPDHGMYDSYAIAVSADGRRVAFRDLVVDVVTMEWSQVPHLPEAEQEQGYATAIKMIGFTDDGLVYVGAPFEQGIGATWLLRDDGTTVRVDPPEGADISDADSADVALAYDNADDNSDTCVTTWLLHDATWEEWKTACMGQYLGEGLAVSPETDWLVTDDMPRVWGLADGEWHRVDMPDSVGKAQMDAQMGGVVWETADSFLLPVADRWSGLTSPEPEFVQHVQVVRCTMSTGACERAGDEQYLPVTSTMWGTTELRFAQP